MGQGARGESQRWVRGEGVVVVAAAAEEVVPYREA